MKVFRGHVGQWTCGGGINDDEKTFTRASSAWNSCRLENVKVQLADL